MLSGLAVPSDHRQYGKHAEIEVEEARIVPDGRAIHKGGYFSRL
jgi:hypothetical protein